MLSVPADLPSRLDSQLPTPFPVPSPGQPNFPAWVNSLLSIVTEGGSGCSAESLLHLVKADHSKDSNCCCNLDVSTTAYAGREPSKLPRAVRYSPTNPASCRVYPRHATQRAIPRSARMHPLAHAPELAPKKSAGHKLCRTTPGHQINNWRINSTIRKTVRSFRQYPHH